MGEPGELGELGGLGELGELGELGGLGELGELGGLGVPFFDLAEWAVGSREGCWGLPGCRRVCQGLP